jgi:hypothetical protein
MGPTATCPLRRQETVLQMKLGYKASIMPRPFRLSGGYEVLRGKPRSSLVGY